MSRVGIWRYTNLGGTNSDNTNQIIFQFQQIKICFYQIISFAFYIYLNLQKIISTLNKLKRWHPSLLKDLEEILPISRYFCVLFDFLYKEND